MKIEPHFFSALAASEAAIAVLDFLAETDPIATLKNLIYIQHDLFIHILNGTHYGSTNLGDFLDYTYEVKDEYRRLIDAD